MASRLRPLSNGRTMRPAATLRRPCACRRPQGARVRRDRLPGFVGVLSGAIFTRSAGDGGAIVLPICCLEDALQTVRSLNILDNKDNFLKCGNVPIPPR